MKVVALLLSILLLTSFVVVRCDDDDDNDNDNDDRYNDSDDNNDDDEYYTILSGSNQSPAINTPTTGRAYFDLDDDEDEYEWTIQVSNVQNLIMAHIHLVRWMWWLHARGGEPCARTVGSWGACAEVEPGSS